MIAVREPPAASAAGYEVFPHDADVGVRGWGPTVDEAFVQGGRALFSLMVDPATVRGDRSVPILCEGSDLETLFVEWLNALVTAKDVERMMFCEFAVTVTGTALSASVRGEAWDTERHRFRTEVKGATYTALRSEVGPGRVLFQCVVDV